MDVLRVSAGCFIGERNFFECVGLDWTKRCLVFWGFPQSVLWIEPSDRMCNDIYMNIMSSLIIPRAGFS